jgi:site-specific DNA recombinase
MKNIIYCRRSSEDSNHQVLSIESQQNELLSFAEKQNIKVDKVFIESMSAKQPGRPVFAEVIDYIEKYQGATILVWKLDRLARNPVDEGKIKWLLQTKVISKIVTPERIYRPEDNALIASVEFGMANQYIRDLSTNIKRGNKTKLEKGELPGPAPLGYLDNPITKLKTIDPVKGPFIKLAFELYSDGTYSLRMVNSYLFEKGFKTKGGLKLSKAMLHTILQNPFYYGMMRRNGQLYQGKHEPLISKELFDTCQDVLAGKSRPRLQKHFFPVRGFMTCANCGCALTPVTKKGHAYYYCTNGKGNCEQHKKYLRDKAVDLLVANVLNEIKFDEDDIEMAYLAAKEKLQSQGTFNHSQKTGLTKQLKTAQDKLSNLADIISSDPSLKDSLKAKILSLEANIKSFQTQLNQLNEKPQQDPLVTLELTKKTFLQACNASFEYLDADGFKQFEMLKKLLWNLKVKDKNVQCYQFKKPYQLMAEAPKKMNIDEWCPGQESNLHALAGATTSR